jgi:hypothetical protein
VEENSPFKSGVRNQFVLSVRFSCTIFQFILKNCARSGGNASA